VNRLSMKLWVGSVVLGLLLASSPAFGQGAAWRRKTQPGSALTASDLALQDAAIQRGLDRLPNDGVEPWKNPDTGNSGSVKPVASFMDGELRCRQFELEIVTVQTRQRVLKACRQPDGTWKLH